MDLTSKSNTPLAQTADTEEVEGARAPSTSSVYSVKSLSPPFIHTKFEDFALLHRLYIC